MFNTSLILICTILLALGASSYLLVLAARKRRQEDRINAIYAELKRDRKARFVLPDNAAYSVKLVLHELSMRDAIRIHLDLCQTFRERTRAMSNEACKGSEAAAAIWEALYLARRLITANQPLQAARQCRQAEARLADLTPAS